MSTVKTIYLKFDDKQSAHSYLKSKGWQLDGAWFKGRSDADEVGVIYKKLDTFTIDDDGFEVYDHEELQGYHVNIYTQDPIEFFMHESLIVNSPSRRNM